MNIRIKSTGKVHDARGIHSRTHQCTVFWIVCNGEIPYFQKEVDPTTDPLTCNTCLKLLEKKK